MAQVLTINASDDDESDDEDVIITEVVAPSGSVGTRLRSRKRAAQATVNYLAVSSDDDEVHSSLSPTTSSEDSMTAAVPSQPKTKTRRGIAACNNDSYNEDAEVEGDCAIYTSQIDVLRQKKKHLESESLREFERENEELEEESTKKQERLQRVREARQKCMETTPGGSDDESFKIDSPPPLELAVKNTRPTAEERMRDELIRSLQRKTNTSLQSEDFLNEDDLEAQLINDEANRKIDVKFSWRATIHRIPMKKNDRFHSILPKLSEITGLPARQLLLSVDDTIIQPEDTPASRGVTIAKVVECGTVPLDTQTPSTTVANNASVPEARDPNCIRLKLQAKDQKSKVVLTIRKNELLSYLMEAYAEKQGIPLEKLTFTFDGEVLSPDETPEDLDLEDDFCLDVIVQQ